MRQCVMRRLISVALGIVMIILAGCSFSVPVREEESTDSTVVIKADQKEDTEQARETEIYVHVCGCVKKPGVYRLHFGARTQEAIDAAGGFSEKANQHGIWQKFFRMECKCTSLLKMRRRKRSMKSSL